MAERNLNKVQLIGHLVAEPEMRYNDKGDAITNFSVASGYTWSGENEDEEHEETEVFHITVWGKKGELCNQHLTKDVRVYVEGRQTSRPEDAGHGAGSQTSRIIAQDVILLGDKRAKGSGLEKDLNRIQIIGRLGRDPEARNTAQGKLVVNFSVATGGKWQDRSGREIDDTEWFKIVAWNRLADICKSYLKKGSRVYLEGRLKTRKWTDRNDQDRYTTELIARDMLMLSGREGEGGSGSSARPEREGEGRSSSYARPEREGEGGSGSYARPEREGSQSKPPARTDSKPAPVEPEPPAPEQSDSEGDYNDGDIPF